MNQQQLGNPNSDNFRIGLTFESFQALTIFKEKYENTKLIQMCIFHARTIEAARRHGIKRDIEANLKYYDIAYNCIHGGQWVSRSKGERPNQASLKQGCPFALRLKVTMDGKGLEVVHFVDYHNHAVSEKRYNFLPRQIHLKGESKLQRRLKKLQAKKKLLQNEHLPPPELIRRDSTNLAELADDDTLEGALQYLGQKETGTVSVVKSEKNIFMGFFYQDEEMKRLFSCYPEVLFIDAFYEVSDLTLCILAIEDGNGETEIVGFFLVTTETEATISKMVQLFKMHNENWINTKAIMSDQDFLERKAFREEFPEASLNTCLFHSLRAFRREITTEKMGITTGERKICLELMQQMAYAKNETDYRKLRELLIKTNVIPVITYFKEFWHPIRNEWVIALQNTFTFQNEAKNRHESMNSKVIQIVKRDSTLPELFKNLDNFIMSHRLEKDYKVAQIDLKTSLLSTGNEDQKNYLDLLTPYAYGVMTNNFKLVDDVVVESDPLAEIVQVKSRSGTQYVTTTKCTCTFFTNMGLPCHHILKVKQLNMMSLFSPSLVSPRWTKSYYVKNSQIVSSGTLSNDSPIDDSHTNDSHTIDLNTNDSLSNDSLINDWVNNNSLTNNLATTSTVKAERLLKKEKFQLIKDRANKIAGLAYEAPRKTFQHRIDIMDKMIELLEAGKDVEINELEIPATNQNPQRCKKQRIESSQTDNIIELNRQHSSESPSSPEILASELKPVARKRFSASKSSKTLFRKRT